MEKVRELQTPAWLRRRLGRRTRPAQPVQPVQPVQYCPAGCPAQMHLTIRPGRTASVKMHCNLASRRWPHQSPLGPSKIHVACAVAGGVQSCCIEAPPARLVWIGYRHRLSPYRHWLTAGPGARVNRESGQSLTAAALSELCPVPPVSWPSTIGGIFMQRARMPHRPLNCMGDANRPN